MNTYDYCDFKIAICRIVIMISFFNFLFYFELMYLVHVLVIQYTCMYLLFKFLLRHLFKKSFYSLLVKLLWHMDQSLLFPNKTSTITKNVFHLNYRYLMKFNQPILNNRKMA